MMLPRGRKKESRLESHPNSGNSERTDHPSEPQRPRRNAGASTVASRDGETDPTKPLRDEKLAVNTVKQRMAGVQFFFARTLRRPYLRADFPYPKAPHRLPNVLSREEVTRLIDATSNLSHRTMSAHSPCHQVFTLV